MILSTDVPNIIVKRVLEAGLPVYQKGNIPLGDVKSDRITVIGRGITPETFWNKCFVEVNIIAPDFRGEADTIHLNDLERRVYPLLDHYVGVYDDTVYHLEVEPNGLMEDAQFHCHYVNLRVQFNIQNVR